MVESFEIELTSSTGVFFPGQLVEGHVYCVTRERMKARAIVVCIIGRGKVQWIERAKNQPVRHHGHSASSYAGSRFYSNEIVYINSEITVWSPKEEQDHHLSAGNHKFHFDFTLPDDCAPSFEGELGYIRYLARAKIDRPWSLNYAARTVFTVMPHFDLRNSSSEGRVVVEASLSKCGVVPGETITMMLKIENGAPRTVIRVETSFVQSSHNTGIMRDSGGKEVKRHSDRSIQTFKDPFEVPSKKLVIQVDYFFKVQIFFHGWCAPTILIEVPVIVGTIPTHLTDSAIASAASSSAVYAWDSRTAEFYESSSQFKPIFAADGAFADVMHHEQQADVEDDSRIAYAPKYIFLRNISSKLV
uniref:Arrestin C-terminal-like domain-containing protein n=1 Tax=Ditylenchus dipsaci TaxID=166011 RepID=A0A915CXT5_9BILA